MMSLTGKATMRSGKNGKVCAVSTIKISSFRKYVDHCFFPRDNVYFVSLNPRDMRDIDFKKYIPKRVLATIVDYTAVFALIFFYIFTFGTQTENGYVGKDNCNWEG